MERIMQPQFVTDTAAVACAWHQMTFVMKCPQQVQIMWAAATICRTLPKTSFQPMRKINRFARQVIISAIYSASNGDV